MIRLLVVTGLLPDNFRTGKPILEAVVRMIVTKELHQGNGYSDLVHPYPQILVTTLLLIGVGLVKAGIMIPVIPPPVTLARARQPHSPRIRHREPTVRHRSTTGLGGQHLVLTRANQRLFPSNHRTGQDFTPVPWIRVWHITPSLPRPDQPVDRRTQTSPVSTLRSVTRLERNILALRTPIIHNVPHLTAPLGPRSLQPMGTGEPTLTSTRLSMIF